MTATASTRMLATSDGRFNLEDIGEGAAIVLLHGFALDLRMWDDQIETFSRGHRVVRYDLRGFGRSPAPDGKPYSHASDLLNIFDAIGLERAFVLGLSLGSNVALQFAAEHPERLLGLILASPSLPGYPWRWPGERPREGAGAVAKRDGIEAAKAYWMSHPLFASARAKPEAARKLEQMTRDYTGWHWGHEDSHTKIPPLEPLLKDIRSPTLALYGERDVDAYRELARIVASEISGATLRSFEAAGHVMNLEAPPEFNAAVLDFLASSSDGADRAVRASG